MPDNPIPMAKFGLGDIGNWLRRGAGELGNRLLPGDPFEGLFPPGELPAISLPSMPSWPSTGENAFWPSWGDEEPTPIQPPAPGVNGTTNIHGCQIYVPLQTQNRLRAPRGYVVVTRTNADGSKQKVGMLKEAAIKCGLWKRDPKPPITASQYKTLRTANSVIKKVDRVVKMTNEIQGKNRLTRSRSGRC